MCCPVATWCHHCMSGSGLLRGVVLHCACTFRASVCALQVCFPLTAAASQETLLAPCGQLQGDTASVTNPGCVSQHHSTPIIIHFV